MTFDQVLSLILLLFLIIDYDVDEPDVLTNEQDFIPGPSGLDSYIILMSSMSRGRILIIEQEIDGELDHGRAQEHSTAQISRISCARALLVSCKV